MSADAKGRLANGLGGKAMTRSIGTWRMHLLDGLRAQGETTQVFGCKRRSSVVATADRSTRWCIEPRFDWAQQTQLRHGQLQDWIAFVMLRPVAG